MSANRKVADFCRFVDNLHDNYNGITAEEKIKLCEIVTEYLDDTENCELPHGESLNKKSLKKLVHLRDMVCPKNNS